MLRVWVEAGRKEPESRLRSEERVRTAIYN
jgi:hypothetical protein